MEPEAREGESRTERSGPDVASGLEARFEGLLGEWDRHVRECLECLSFAEHRCYEGEWLTESIGSVRAALEATRSGTRRHPTPLPSARFGRGAPG